MMNKITRILSITLIVFLFSGLESIKVYAQIASTSDNLVAQPISDRSIIYQVDSPGISKPVIWGLDLAWLSDRNVRRGIAFMDKANVNIIRSSFMPTDVLLNGNELQGDALTNTNLRISIINNLLGAGANVVLNCDHPSVNSYFYGNAVNWAKLIEVTAQKHIDAGFNIVTVSPFNEPDYAATGQGTIQHFNNINLELKNNTFFNYIRVSGGNTLNNDQASTWYNYLKINLDEGNTHQLAGSFDNYANFYQTVSSEGKHATNDELHNVMEAMVGVEYGLQTGIWWGTAEYARGEFCKASNGKRLGYAEHRNNWSAASVYRQTNGKVQAFGGVSERQARPTNYAFLSKDRVVYYDGYGPQRDYVMELPADPNGSYQTALQRNAERVVNITWGEDIQPVINGQYIIVNKNSGKVMEVFGTGNGANVRQNTYTGANNQKFNITPVPIDIGGDFSYYRIQPVSDANRSLDVVNFSLDNGGNIHLWDSANGGNQQWYMDYKANGWFLIRNRESSYCLDVWNAATNAGANVVQWQVNGGNNQEWRFLPVGSPIEFIAPSAPTNLLATAQAVSIKLNWTASPEGDVAGYTILRSESSSGPYNTIARNVTETSLVDNTTVSGIQYYYVARAEDNSLNRSGNSNQVNAIATGGSVSVVQYDFENNTLDSTINLNHSAPYNSVSYTSGQIGSALVLTNNFLQAPADIANHQEITVASWIYRIGNASWQRVFDFGNNTDEYMFLTPWSPSGKLHFGIKNGGTEQSLQANGIPTGSWQHVAITISGSGTVLYLNGNQVAQNSSMLISPKDFKPIQNYIGRSQWQDPLFNGRLDDFRVYNYALAPNQISQLYNGTLATESLENLNNFTVWPIPAKNELHVELNSKTSNDLLKLQVYNIQGRILMSEQTKERKSILNIANLPAGIYLLKLSNATNTVTKKFVVN